MADKCTVISFNIDKMLLAQLIKKNYHSIIANRLIQDIVVWR